jgi:OmpA-OmpF porin, OOP family
MRIRAVLLPLLALSVAPRLAAADTPPSLDLRGFHAPTDPASGLYLEPADSPGSGEWNTALWLNYVYRPIVLRDAQTNQNVFDVIKNQLTGDLTGNIGFRHRVAIGFDLPVLLYQNGDAPTAASTAALGGGSPTKTSLGDLGIDAKVTIVRPTGEDLGGFALAMHERFTFPTADPGSYLGGGSVTSETRLLAEYRLVALSIHGAVGVKLQKEQPFACADLGNTDLCPTRIGQEIPFGLGFALRPQAFGIDEKGHWTWYLETHGYVPLAPVNPFQNAALAEAQVDLGARYGIKDFSILAGVETALDKGIGNPLFRGVLSVGWAPREHDMDHDGIPDDVDQCPELPEDHDGFQDADGCPDGDNDDDGIPDVVDRCPNVPEDMDGFQDEDGCPDPDNDGDGILDKDDACPNEPGPRSADPKRNGCPVVAPPPAQKMP